MLLKQETQTFVNGLLGFYYFRHLYPLEARVYCFTIIAWVAHRYGQLYLHCSLIYFWVPSSCFCIVISLSLEGEIIPFSGVCQSGGGCIIHAGGGGGFTHWLTDCFDAPDDDQRQHHRADIISSSALASANSFVYFASSAATSRWRICMSVIAAFASASVLWHFLSRWAL